MKYNRGGKDKIGVYFLIKEDIPYYVGVTSVLKSRYSGEKRTHIEFIEFYNNRVSARNSESFWIEQLTQWGFKLQNKESNPRLIPYRSNKNIVTIISGITEEELEQFDESMLQTEILVNKRFDITEKQAEKLSEIERELKIPPSAIVRIALNCFLPKVRDDNFRYSGIKELWNSNKF